MAGTPPPDGRLPSQPQLTSALIGSELMYIVSPGNNQAGVSYCISTASLAAFFSQFAPFNATIITSGAVYNVLPTDTRILIDKTVAGPITLNFPAANTMIYPGDILVKDIKGNVSTINVATLSFSTACDGLATIPIENPYGWVTVTPIPNSANWYSS